MTSVPPAPPGQARRSLGWIWWLGGGCALIVVLMIAGAAFGAVSLYNSLYNRFQPARFNCLPSDFPTYPGSTHDSYNFELNGPTPGNSCHMVLRSKDSAAAVQGFYQSRLDTGNWQVTSSDPGAGQISFRNLQQAKTKGVVEIAARNSYTEITVQLYSP